LIGQMRARLSVADEWMGAPAPASSLFRLAATGSGTLAHKEGRETKEERMSTGAIIVIAVVVAIILIALLALMPRMREGARIRKRERELKIRRQQAESQHLQQAEARSQSAEAAEQRARIAEQEAQRERAEAELHQQRATAVEQGHADHELIEDHEREHFAGTSAVPEGQDAANEDGSGSGRTSAYEEGRMSAHEPGRQDDFQDGRAEEAQRDSEGGLLGRFRRRGSADDRETARRS
jgi:type IV secretory pathway VirB10-like protein